MTGRNSIASGGLFSQTHGAPALPTRLIAGLHYLKHLYNLSDEEVVRGCMESPYPQYFYGEHYFQRRLPIHRTSMSRWRSRIGEEAREWLLTQTIEAGRKSGALKDKDCRRVNVDTTLQEKAVAFPTDSKLLDDARRQVVKRAERHEINLRQNYNRVAKRSRLKISRPASARHPGSGEPFFQGRPGYTHAPGVRVPRAEATNRRADTRRSFRLVSTCPKFVLALCPSGLYGQHACRSVLLFFPVVLLSSFGADVVSAKISMIICIHPPRTRGMSIWLPER